MGYPVAAARLSMPIRPRNSRESAFRRIATAFRQLAELQDRARELGVFPNDRPLLSCPKCGLEEDVAGSCLLFVTKRGARGVDTGLRFRLNLKLHRAVCPSCGTELEWDENEVVKVIKPKSARQP